MSFPKYCAMGMITGGDWDALTRNVLNRGGAATAVVGFNSDLSGRENYFLCDGTADDVQLQLAVDYVAALGGGTIHVEFGTYDITATVTLQSDIVWHAVGATFVEANGTNLPILVANTEARVEIIGGNYDGNKANNTGNVVEFLTCTDSVIRDTYVYDAETQAIFISRGTRIEIRNNFVSNSERGIYLYKTDLASVVDNWVDDCDDFGIVATTDAEKIHILNNFVVDCLDGQGYGIEVLSASPYSEIMGNHVDNCNINLYVKESDYARVIGNYSSQSGNFGIAIESSDYCVVGDNICRLNGRMGIKLLIATYCTVTGNVCVNNGTNEDANLRSGIWLDQSTYNTINGNVCTDDQGPKTQTYGIREFEDTSHHNIVTSNELIGNLTGGLFLAGSETTAFHNRVDGTNSIATVVIVASKPFQFTEAVNGAIVTVSPTGVDVDATTEAALAWGQLPIEVQQVVRLKIWAVATDAPIGAGGQMHLEVVFNAGASNAAYNEAGKSWTIADFDGEEVDYVANDVVHWVIEDTDVGTELVNLVAGDSFEMFAIWETGADPDGATDALFRVVEVEYV